MKKIILVTLFSFMHLISFSYKSTTVKNIIFSEQELSSNNFAIEKAIESFFNPTTETGNEFFETYIKLDYDTLSPTVKEAADSLINTANNYSYLFLEKTKYEISSITYTKPNTASVEIILTSPDIKSYLNNNKSKLPELTVEKIETRTGKSITQVAKDRDKNKEYPQIISISSSESMLELYTEGVKNSKKAVTDIKKLNIEKINGDWIVKSDIYSM